MHDPLCVYRRYDVCASPDDAMCVRLETASVCETDEQTLLYGAPARALESERERKRESESAQEREREAQHLRCRRNAVLQTAHTRIGEGEGVLKERLLPRHNA